jgi:hypothetical protein
MDGISGTVDQSAVTPATAATAAQSPTVTPAAATDTGVRTAPFEIPGTPALPPADPTGARGGKSAVSP